MADGLDVIQQQFPHYQIWQEFTRNRMRYIARRTVPGPGLHTVVTKDLSELHAALSADRPAIPAQADYPQTIEDDYPGWGVRHEGGTWTAWCPAVIVHSATAAGLRALIEQAIDADDPEWDDPA